jgi:hypothetical protein
MSANAKSEPGYFRIPNQPAHIKVLQRFNVSIAEKSPRLFSCHFVATAAIKATYGWHVGLAGPLKSTIFPKDG